MKRKLSTETHVCPQERLVIISYTTSLSFALERIGPLAAITIIVFYLLILYLLALPNTPENPFASISSESLIKTTCQHLLLLVGFDTYLLKVLRYTPYTCGSSGCRCAAPSGCNVAAFRLRHRLPTCLPRRVRRWWSCRCIDSRPVATCPFRASRRYTRSSLSSPRTASQAVAASPSTVRVATSTHGLRQASGSSSPTSSTAAAPLQVTCTTSSGRHRSRLLHLR
jgi:hypothetical protein